VSGSVSDQRVAARVRDLRERPASPGPQCASRVSPTNTLTPTLTPMRPATRGPVLLGGPQFPDRF
jgi:hypothetical protein